MTNLRLSGLRGRSVSVPRFEAIVSSLHLVSQLCIWLDWDAQGLKKGYVRQEVGGLLMFWYGVSPNMETSCLNTAVSEWRFQQRPTPSLQASLIDLAGIKHIHIYILHTINEIICLEMGRCHALAVNLQGSHWVFFLRLDKGRAAETYLGTQGFSVSSTSDISDLCYSWISVGNIVYFTSFSFLSSSLFFSFEDLLSSFL